MLEPIACLISASFTCAVNNYYEDGYTRKQNLIHNVSEDIICQML